MDPDPTRKGGAPAPFTERLNTRTQPSPTPHVAPADGAPLKFQFDIDQIKALCLDCGRRMCDSVIVGRNDKLPGIAEQRICLLHKDCARVPSINDRQSEYH